MALRSLNDDCLIYLFRFLDPEDLIRIEEVSLHFRELVLQFYRICRTYEWSRKRHKVNQKMIERVGGNLRELIYQGIGSRDVDCFTLVNQYCQRIERLSLFDVTIDMNLITLLMPVLENLKKLHIDRYLLIKKSVLPNDQDNLDRLSDMQCLMLCIPNLTHLFIGEPFDKDSFMGHEYLSMLLNLKSLTLNLSRNSSFKEFGEYFDHTFLPLTSLELTLPNNGFEDYDKFCSGLENLKQLKELKLHNLQNAHFWLLIASVRNIKCLEILHLNCVQGLILNKSLQYLLNKIDNKTLVDVRLCSLKNLSFQFLHPLKWWNVLTTFDLDNCEKFKNEDLLAILMRVHQKFTKITIRGASLTPEIVHLLARVSKVRRYNLTLHFYHETQEIFEQFQKESNRTIIQYINVHNSLIEK